jgi:ABC-type dipeptide/oligopeptide/nickel transport system permease subunit
MNHLARKSVLLSSLLDLFSQPTFSAGFGLLLCFVAAAMAAPYLYPKHLTAMAIDPNLIAHCSAPSGPTLSLIPFSLGPHPLGQTAYLGFGVAQGLIAGSRWDLFLIGSISLSAAVIGLGVGLVAGTYGGRVDSILMSITDMLLSIPYFIFVILVVVIVLPHLTTAQGPDVFVVSMVGVMWAPFARVVRGEALRNRQMAFVESARASGASTPQLMIRHILPNSLSPALAQIPISVALILAFIIASQFVTYYENSTAGTECRMYRTNVSAVAPVVPTFNYPDWGSTLSAGIVYFGAISPQAGAPFGPYWWGAAIPAVWITIFGLSVILISDGLRDWISPRSRR